MLGFPAWQALFQAADIAFIHFDSSTLPASKSRPGLTVARRIYDASSRLSRIVSAPTLAAALRADPILLCAFMTWRGVSGNGQRIVTTIATTGQFEQARDAYQQMVQTKLDDDLPHVNMYAIAVQGALTCCYTPVESMNMRSRALLEASDGAYHIFWRQFSTFSNTDFAS